MHSNGNASLLDTLALYYHFLDGNFLFAASAAAICATVLAILYCNRMCGDSVPLTKAQERFSKIMLCALCLIAFLFVPLSVSVSRAYDIITTVESGNYSITGIARRPSADPKMPGFIVTSLIISKGKIVHSNTDGSTGPVTDGASWALNGHEYAGLYYYCPAFRVDRAKLALLYK
jgi:hypothetical protein